MNDRTQEFRVGLMAIAAVSAAVIMVFKFGEIGNSLRSGTRIGIVMTSASGVMPQSSVQMSGIRIGQVESTQLIADGRGVLVSVRIDHEFSFKNDSTAQVQQSLLGDAAIQIIPGTEGEPIKEGDRIAGRAAADPMAVVNRVERRLDTTLASFESTGQQWSRLGHNLNQMMESTGPDGVSTMQRSAQALEQFTKTMRAAEETLASAGSLISDPRYQKHLQATLEALPELLNETRGTLKAVNGVIREVDSTVANLNIATEPLANQSPQMVARLNKSLANIETITADLAEVSRLMNENDGSLKRLATDPTMYRNLNSTSASLASLLQNLRPVVRDLQVFSDKVARHPELLGVRGIVRGSDGLKDGDVRPASFERPKE